MSHMQYLNIELIRGMKEEFPKLRILPKSKSMLCKSIDKFLCLITLGKFKNFMDYHTTIGYTIYLSDRLYPVDYNSVTLYEILRHERIHLKQMSRWHIWYGLSYLLILISLFTCRAKWESEAYMQSICAHIYTFRLFGKANAVRERGPDRVYFSSNSSMSWKKYLEKQFCGPPYLYMFYSKKKFNKWFEEAWRIANTDEYCKDIDIVYPIKYRG